MVNSYQDKMKEKIPIEITWMKNQDGILEPEIIMDAEDYVSFNTSIAEAIVKFKKQYMKLFEKAQEILPEDKTKRKSSHFWQIGRLLYKFNKSVKNEFEIINFKEAISHDFKLYKFGYFLSNFYQNYFCKIKRGTFQRKSQNNCEWYQVY